MQAMGKQNFTNYPLLATCEAIVGTFWIYLIALLRLLKHEVPTLQSEHLKDVYCKFRLGRTMQMHLPMGEVLCIHTECFGKPCGSNLLHKLYGCSSEGQNHWRMRVLGVSGDQTLNVVAKRGRRGRLDDILQRCPSHAGVLLLLFICWGNSITRG